MSLVDRVAARLAALRDGLPVDALHTAATGLDHVARDVGALADGTDNPHLVSAYAAFQRARTAIDDALVALGALAGYLTDYQRALGVSDVLPFTTCAPLAAASDRRVPSDQDITAHRLLAELPVRGPRDKTRGLWVDEHGTKHRLISGEHEVWHQQANSHAVRIGMIPPDARLSIASHVEVKLAMRMRSHGIRKAVLVVNKSPCPGAFGCDERLWEFLAEGAELTVYGPEGFCKTYHGRSE